MKNRSTIRNFILLFAGVAISVNFLSNRFFLRLDLTEDQRYTLSKATKDILRNLDEPVTVTAYFSKDLPPDIAKIRKDFQELLVEYASRSRGQLVFEFKNPNADEEVEQQAIQNGIQPVVVNVREKDQIKQQKAYLGAVVRLREKQEVIPFMQPGAAMEYALSSAIKKMSVDNKPVIGFIQGHGEPSLAALQQANASLSVLYQTESVTLHDTLPLSARYETLALINPTDSISPLHLRQLDEHLARGGQLFIAYQRVQGDLGQAMGQSRYTGLEDWLGQKGIQIEDRFLVDANCGAVNVRQQQAGFVFQTSVPFPYFPQISSFEDHPAVKGLEAVLLQFTSAIQYTGDTTVQFIPLARTSDKTGSVAAPLYFDIQKQWNDADFTLGSQVIAAAFYGKLAGNANSRIILVSNGDFAINGEGQMAVQLPPDNVNLLVNSIDYLSDDTGLIDLRTKGVTNRPLKQVEDSTKALLKYLNFLLPLLLVVLYGVIRLQMNKHRRTKNMEEQYV